jgi:hypothetical protein
MHGGPPPRRHYGGGCGTTLIAIIIVVIYLFATFAFGGISYSSSSTKSTIQREKLDTGNAYINDCIVDELGWFENKTSAGTQLKKFWEKTGVQPYVILKAYDASLQTNEQKEQWAKDYYDEHFNTENIFLYVYFAEQDVDNDVGYMAYANGYQTSSVMDSEAVEIFWDNIDKYWYSDATTDEVFVNAFNDTAKTIMHVSTTGKDIIKWIVILIIIIVVGVVVINLIKQKNQRAKEKAEEDQRILNTPINDIAQDDLEKKYLDK